MHFLKKGQKIRAWVDPYPLIRAMPERKHFFPLMSSLSSFIHPVCRYAVLRWFPFTLEKLFPSFESLERNLLLVLLLLILTNVHRSIQWPASWAGSSSQRQRRRGQISFLRNIWWCWKLKTVRWPGFQFGAGSTVLTLATPSSLQRIR